MNPTMVNFLNLFFLVLLVVFYSIFIWKFYRFIATKNLIKLNLNQYNKSEHPATSKFLKVIFYFIEYIVILPFLIFFWFFAFTLFLIILTKNIDINTILIISATIIASIRMTAYYKEDLSKDLAKLLPFTLLGIAITTKGFFNADKILTQINQIPLVLSSIFPYLVFILLLEIILRSFELLFSVLNINDNFPKEKNL